MVDADVGAIESAREELVPAFSRLDVGRRA